MVEGNAHPIRIDLNQFKLHLCLKPKVESTFHFSSASRRFYLSVIALVVHEMKKQEKIVSIPLASHHEVLALLNETVGGSAGSSEKEALLSRIYRKWKDALPDLENAPLFRVVGRRKRSDETSDNGYGFSEGEKDIWANLFEYKGSHEHVRLRFSIDRLGANLDDVIIIYGADEAADRSGDWQKFITSLSSEKEDYRGHGDAEKEMKALDGLASQPPSGVLKKNLNKKLFAAICACCGAAALILAVVMWKIESTSREEVSSVEGTPRQEIEKASIAVLPFRNLSGDPRQDYFSDGISEILITDLAKIPSLSVIASISSSTYKGKPTNARQVAEELGVKYILEGSVQIAGDQVRINAQLIDATIDEHLWAERYDSEIRNIFSLQDKITAKIVSSLAVELTEDERYQITQKSTDNVEAFEAYLKGITISNSLRNNPGKFVEALPWLEKAIELDPGFSEAYAALAETYIFGTLFGVHRELKISLRLAQLRGNHYLRLAMIRPTNLAYRNSARVANHRRQHEKAIEFAARAIEISPNDYRTNAFMALTLINTGSSEEAVLYTEKMRKADPACLW